MTMPGITECGSRRNVRVRGTQSFGRGCPGFSSRATAKLARRQSVGLPVGFADCRRQNQRFWRGTRRDQPAQEIEDFPRRCRRPTCARRQTKWFVGSAQGRTADGSNQRFEARHRRAPVRIRETRLIKASWFNQSNFDIAGEPPAG